MTSYRITNKNDLNEIAKIHIKAFPEYFLTTFGEKLILEFYKSFLENNEVFVVAEKDSKIIGFILGNKILWKGIFSRLFFIKEAILIKLFPKKEKSEKKNNCTISNSYRLLSIAILPEMKGNNIAYNMEKYFVEKCAQKGVINLGLSVHSNNFRAINFYKKCEYQVENQTEKSIYFIKKITK